MLSFEEFKKSLGVKANSLSDEEIENRRTMADKIAEIFFDYWIKRKNQHAMSNDMPLKNIEIGGKIIG